MKNLYFLLLFLLSFLGFSQLDSEHWFAPMASRAGNGGAEGYLYLSTNETTPFSVQIFNNNILYTTTTISKGNPQEVFIPNNMMMTTFQWDMFTPISKGLLVKGTKKFFANYRFAVTNHAEIITSKGLAGLGKKFYVGLAPLTASPSYVNSTIGVIATEDNTTVTLSNYNPGVVFSDGSSSLNKTFTLNKGQSYIIETKAADSPFNLNGLIGAKIESNKPISVTNGNFNGLYTNFNFSNNDILMDQSVPTDRLGNNFVVVKGAGSTTSGMEQVLIIATENNTQITVNGNPTGITLNEGEYTLIDGSNYANQGNNHYNLSVQTTKNVYLYQLLAGTGIGNEYATGGFNYIPPLSCFLPNKIDEIGSINILGNNSYETKLNIITQTGANITVNGSTPSAFNGPYPVLGNPQWVTYSIPSITGNVTIISNKSVTAGIAAGSGAVGYGGYFAGFSSVPAIAKTGDCYSGIFLQVDNNYDSYQWYLNGVAIPGATTHIINPDLYGPGNYTVLIIKTNCESKITEPYSYVLCPPITSSTQNIGSCNVLTISPVFTNSSQSINPTLSTIIAPPSIGTASVNTTTGVITYTPPNGLTTDTQTQFVYYIEGNGNPADFEYFRVFVNIDVLETNNSSLTTCETTGGQGIFDLTNAILSTDSGASVQYFTNVGLTNSIINPNSFSSNSGTVYALVTSQFGCSKSAEISLLVNPLPNINTNNYNAALCDDNFDGIIPVIFSNITPIIVNNSANFIVRYYSSNADALLGNNNTLPNTWSYNAPNTVFVRVDGLAGNNCPPAFGSINFNFGNSLLLNTNEITITLCDPDGNNSEMANLNNYISNFTTAPGISTSFHNTLADAQNDVNPINFNQTINGTGVFYIRFESNNACPAVGKINFNLLSLNVFPASLSVCGNSNGVGTFNLSSASVTTNTGVSISYFTNATLTSPITNFTNYQSANATVYAQVSLGNNCNALAPITLTVIASPNLNIANYNSTLCDDNLDGIVDVNFSNVSPQIVNNYTQYNIRYYLAQADAIAGNNNNLPNNWSFNATTTVYVRVDTQTGSCPPVFGQIVYSIGNKISLLTQETFVEECDNDLDGSTTINLFSYIDLFTNIPGTNASFHNTLSDAQNDVNPVNPNPIIIGTTVFYIRLENNSACPNVGKLIVGIKSPKNSEILKDKVICPNTKTLLDAGLGFDSYLWSTGATTQSILVGPGIYSVKLESNGCIYQQFVEVKPADLPKIDKIDVKGNQATILVSGGTPPYLYSLDNFNWQSANVFLGLPKGNLTVYVLSNENCEPVSKSFLVLNLINAITPNGDGINDVLDYSDLRTKQDVSIEIYDRFGARIFRNEEKKYTWDGKLGGRPLVSGTYWFILRWTETDTKEKSEYSDWIIIKNK